MRLPFLLAAIVLAAPAAAELSGPTAALREPTDGATLVAGEMATLRWDAGRGLSGQRFEEWEAFLSVDGGRTYALRITPHLDFDLRTVRWEVPNVESADARLLLRVGDERSETEIRMPARFRIVASSGTPPAWAPQRFGAGEPARPGDAGVVSWVEGDRQGRGWRTVQSSPPAPGVAEGRSPRLRGVERCSACENRGSGDPLAEPTVTARLSPASRSALQTPETPAPSAKDILRLTQRQNE